MAAHFFTANGQTHIISNSMSIAAAGFRPVRSYYNKDGDRLTYYLHESGAVLERITQRRRQPVHNFYHHKDEANSHFKMMNQGKTFQTGKWVPEKPRG